MNGLAFENHNKDITCESKQEVELLKKTNYELLIEKDKFLSNIST